MTEAVTTEENEFSLQIFQIVLCKWKEYIEKITTSGRF